MATVLKVFASRKLPDGAETIVRKGQRYFRKLRGGRAVFLPVSACGTKYTEESRKWYVQYRDHTGKKCRVPGYTDKDATWQLAAELERNVERAQSGLADPFEEGKRRPLAEHLAEFKQSLQGAGNSVKHVEQTCARLERLIEGNEFGCWLDLVPSKAAQWLSTERSEGRLSARTSNYYLSSLKQFCKWLERDGRVPRNASPVEHLQAVRIEGDRRWERRAISPEEFRRLVEAAEEGPKVQCMTGKDRAMLYVLAAWTGYRRSELASLTKASLDLEAEPATIKVHASYSKRRKHDLSPLHPQVAERLREWLRGRGELKRDTPLFNLRAAKGHVRRTSLMMQRDLERARQQWIIEAKDDQERKQREESNFLAYQDEDGLYADFHANRHTFITNLALAGVHPKVAQQMARHSDVNLTMGVYSHVDVAQQSAAVRALPAPPNLTSKEAVKAVAGGAADAKSACPDPPADQSVAPIVAPACGFACHCLAEADLGRHDGPSSERKQKPLQEQGLASICHHLTEDDAQQPQAYLSSGGGIRTPDTRIMIPLL